MNGKTVLASTLVLVMLLTFVAPVIAAPAEEQKVPIKVSFAIVRSETKIVENITTPGNISHIIMTMKWDVNMFIGGSLTPIQGTADVVRDTDYRYKKLGGVDQVIYDQYVMSFPTIGTVGGGFEGFGQSTITDYSKGPPVTYNIRVHVLLHGTGEFEGKTLNAWQTGEGTIPLWEGYLLKA
jgi:hypothetical protein